MNITIENKKQKAIELMQKLDIYKPYIKGFKDKTDVCFFECFGGYWAYQEPELMAKIKEFEEQYNVLVYAVTHEYTEFGECYDFLYVSDYEEEWNEMLYKQGRTFYAYAYKSITTKISNKHVVELDTSSWKNFYLHKIFNATMGNGIDAISTTHENPVFNYVGRSANNNGVTDIIDEIAGEKVFPAGAITLPLGGSIGACFLQTKPFYTAQNVAVLLEKVPLSIAVKMFIVSIIKTECLIKFQPFGRELNAHFRKDFILRLPVKHNRKKIEIDSRNIFSDEGYIPDWQWMENYIKELPYSDRI